MIVLPITRDSAGGQVISLVVERIITKNVAVLMTEDGSVRVVGKHLGLHHDAPRWLAKELAAYTACASLQGSDIPYLHGACRVIQPSPFLNVIMHRPRHYRIQSRMGGVQQI